MVAGFAKHGLEAIFARSQPRWISIAARASGINLPFVSVSTCAMYIVKHFPEPKRLSLCFLGSQTKDPELLQYGLRILQVFLSVVFLEDPKKEK